MRSNLPSSPFDGIVVLVSSLRILCLKNFCILKVFTDVIFKSSTVLCSTFKSMIHFELIFVLNERFRLRFIVLSIDVKGSRITCWKGQPSCTKLLWQLSQKLVDQICVGLFLGFLFSSIDLCLSSPPPTTHTSFLIMLTIRES